MDSVTKVITPYLRDVIYECSPGVKKNFYRIQCIAASGLLLILISLICIGERDTNIGQRRGRRKLFNG